MKIVAPYTKIIKPTLLNSCLSMIEEAARISHRSEDDFEDNNTEKTEKFIRAVVLKHGDWSVTEHVCASIEFFTDRGITHEIVRHRIASYTQESTRFVNYVKKMEPSFIYPKPEIKCDLCLNGNEAGPGPETVESIPYMQNSLWVHKENNTQIECKYDPIWLTSIWYAKKNYDKLISEKWRPQEARSILPNALASKLLVTMNLRSWRQFFLMRTTRETHPQMRELSIPLLKEMQKLVPILFEDIIPMESQVNNISKGR